MHPLAATALVLFGLIATLFALDQLGLWMERRGWIYWRKRKPAGGGMAGVLTEFQQLVEPQVREVRQEREQRRAVRDDETGQGGGGRPPA